MSNKKQVIKVVMLDGKEFQFDLADHDFQTEDGLLRVFQYKNKGAQLGGLLVPGTQVLVCAPRTWKYVEVCAENDAG